MVPTGPIQDGAHDFSRYARQMQLPRVGRDGQQRLARARVLVVGCGALGTVVSELLVRGGVGTVSIVDRDLVEMSNLQRQTLFTEQDARRAVPKAEAAKARLGAINSAVTVRAFVDDLHAANAARYASGCDCIVDGLDNFETRLVLNEQAVRGGVPLVYGGAVGWTGMAAALLPRVAGQGGFGGSLRWSESRATPCLRCLMPDAPSAGETETCDTAGIFGPVAAMVGAMQAGLVLRLFAEGPEHVPAELVRIDFTSLRIVSSALSGARDPDCPCCVRRVFPLSESASPASGACRILCGRNAVEIRLGSTPFDLARIEEKFRLAGEVASGIHGGTHVVRVSLGGPPAPDTPSAISVLASDAGVIAIVDGTRDAEKARSAVARWVGV